MRKIIRYFVTIATLAVLVVILAGCGSGDNAMVGRWRSSSASVTIEFNRNGTGLINDSIDITWSAENGRLTLAGFPDNFSEEIGWPPHVPQAIRMEEVLLESDDHDGEAAVLDISVNWNGIHDYQIITNDIGARVLRIYLHGDIIAPSFVRLGEN